MKKNLVFVVVVVLMAAFVNPIKIYQFRGDNRDGVYNETNLLEKWDSTGLKLLWKNQSVGNGYGSPVVTEEMIYVCGEVDSINYLFAHNLKGERVWKAKIGSEWTINFRGSRSAPTVVNDLIYTTSGNGNLVCFNTKGEKIWEKNLILDFGGRNNRFGFSESLLVDEEKVYCMPGGKDTNVVALNRFTGDLIWICKAESEIPAYTAPLLVRLPTRDLMLTFSKKYLLAIDVKSGEMLWSHKQDTMPESLIDVHCNTPIYENGFIYYATGDGNGAVKLQLSPDGKKITEIWRNSGFDNIMGGFIKKDNFIYGESYGRRIWLSLNTETGKIVDSLKFNKGVTIYADGKLYLYNNKAEMALVNPNHGKMEVISSFKTERGTKEPFSHPVISKGILYLRHGELLMAYNLKKN